MVLVTIASRKMEVLVFGSAIVDFICYVKRLPKAGETIHGEKFVTGFGGKGANQCVAAARLGAKTSMICKLGDDLWGSNYLEHLKDEGVNVEHAQRCQGETTGIAQISVASNGENNIVIVVGANNLLSSEDVIKANDIFKSAKILICQFETPLEATLTALKTFNGISIVNAAPALANTPLEVMREATIFCVNESEAALMIDHSGISTLDQAKTALKELRRMGCNTVIITLGALGAVFVENDHPDDFIHVPASSVIKVIDTTGAGDAFIGSLAFFLARYCDAALHQKIGAACEIAALSVQLPGTQASFPNASQANDINPIAKKYVWREM